MTAESLVRARIFAHLVTAAMDRAHAAADAVLRDNPGLRIEVELDGDDASKIDAADPTDLPSLYFNVFARESVVCCLVCSTSTASEAMRLGLEAGIARSPGEAEAIA